MSRFDRGHDEGGRTLVTVAELAGRWGVDRKTLLGMIDRGELPVLRLGRLIKISLSVVERLESQGSAAPAGG